MSTKDLFGRVPFTPGDVIWRPDYLRPPAWCIIRYKHTRNGMHYYDAEYLPGRAQATNVCFSSSVVVRERANGDPNLGYD